MIDKILWGGMKARRRGVVFLHCLFAVAPLATLGGAAEVQPNFYYRDVELDVTPQQLEKLQAIETRRDGEIARQRDRQTAHEDKTLPVAEAIRDKIHELERARDAEIEAALTPEQRRRLSDARLTDLREQVDRDVRFLREMSGVVADIAKADALVVYEGLARGDEQAIAREKREQKTFPMEGFDFYAEPLSVQPEVVERLRTIVADYRSFMPYGGPKFCGGYHPDICLEWRVADQAFRVFLCLGCHEAQFVGPKHNFMVDIDEAAYEELLDTAATLFKHRKLPARAAP